jgi:hemophore-related protein
MGALAAAALGAAVAVPAAGADPAAPDNCTAEGLATTISSVTVGLGAYFKAHPDVNQALIDATRQPAFVAAGQFDAYFDGHPQQADEIRAIKQPLIDFQNRCGLQVTPAEAFVVLSEL